MDGHGGYPERDVEGAVPYKGAVEMVRCLRRGDSRIARGRLVAAPTITLPYRYPERDVEGAVPYGGRQGCFCRVIIPK